MAAGWGPVCASAARCEVLSQATFALALTTDEVSAVVVDFGSHTTRAGFAGEDGPRVVAPSFYGYMNEEDGEPSAATNGDGDDPMDGGSAPEKDKKKGKRKFFLGDDGVGVWRKDMEVGSFMVDGIGEFQLLLNRRADSSERRRGRWQDAALRPARQAGRRPD